MKQVKMKQVTLQTLINDGAKLTEDQKTSLFVLLVGRSRAETREVLNRRINLPLSLWPNYGIFGRVTLEDNERFEYCAGQDYPSEIAYVRKLIIKG